MSSVGRGEPVKDIASAIEEQEIKLVSSMMKVSKVYRHRMAARGKKSAVFDEYPVDVTTFIEHEEYLGLKGIVWPSVMEDVAEIFNIEKRCDGNRFSTYQEVILDEAIGSGKSFTSSIIIAYLIYRLLCLKDPQRYYGLAPGSLMAVMNMSPTASQAKNVVFGEIKARIDCSQWFRTYGGLDDKIKSVLRFDKGVTILPGNSSESFPLGYNLIAWVMDEGAYYTETAEHDVAQEIYYTLMRRSQSRFKDKWLGVIVSSPRYVDDFIERKMTEAQLYPDIIYAKRRAIWESKPDDIKSLETGDTFDLDGYAIPKVYEKTFTDNPDKAWRDLGARPSLVLEPYFKQWRLVESCIDKDLVHPMSIDSGVFYDWFKGDPRFQYFIHIDLALVKDAAGFAMVHKDGDNVIVDLMQRIKAQSGREIDLAEIRNTIYELIKRGFIIGKVTYDQFQSAESIQELNKRSILSENLSVERTLAPYETMKEMIYSGKARYYFFEPFMREMRRLELIKGKKVDHPAKGSKDVTDAVAGAIYNAIVGGGNTGEMYFNVV